MLLDMVAIFGCVALTIAVLRAIDRWQARQLHQAELRESNQRLLRSAVTTSKRHADEMAAAKAQLAELLEENAWLRANHENARQRMEQATAALRGDMVLKPPDTDEEE